ncbi:ACP S-malonyltransferase [bacterium]|nr:ACP S-malonyltransferase [bacterium]
MKETENKTERIAAIFPGQGSQYVGMGQDLYNEFNSVRQLYKIAEEITGLEISKVSFNGPEEKLKQTQFTQPAIFVHSLAHYSLIEGEIDFSMVAGHSLGEYSALVACGVLSFEDAMAAVKVRGELMAQSTKGTMLAIIGMDIETLQEVVNGLSQKGVITIANYNAPGQVAVSGDQDLLLNSMDEFRKAGAKRVIPLPVGGAFHSPLMKDAEIRMRDILENIAFKKPVMDFYPNVLGEKENSPERIKELLILQITSPVRWIKTIGSMLSEDAGKFVEVGPGNVLRGLVKRIYRDADLVGIDGVTSINEYLNLQDSDNALNTEF